jgi:hypothetical protein
MIPIYLQELQATPAGRLQMSPQWTGIPACLKDKDEDVNVPYD